jgi:hypothetical protein
LLGKHTSHDRPELTYGAVSGLLIAIPLWMLIGAVLAFTFQLGSIEETGSLAFMVAAVVETILLRYACRSFWRKPWRDELAAPRLLAIDAHHAVMSTARQTASFAALATAFLSYYFVDVSLQIAKLNSVTVFVNVAPLLKAAT